MCEMAVVKYGYHESIDEWLGSPPAYARPVTNANHDKVLRQTHLIMQQDRVSERPNSVDQDRRGGSHC